jgi:hypothetical protein
MSFQHRSVQGLGVEKRTHPLHLLGGILLALTLLVLGTQAAQAVSCDPVSRTCTCGIPGGYEYLTLNGSPWQTPSANLYDLRVIGGCRVLQSNVRIRDSSSRTSTSSTAGSFYFMKMITKILMILTAAARAIIQQRTSGRAPSLSKMVADCSPTDVTLLTPSPGNPLAFLRAS